MRAFGRDLIRGGHYGQRSCEPHLKAEHMAAPTNAAYVKKALANSCQNASTMSALGGNPDGICSLRAFPLLTHLRHWRGRNPAVQQPLAAPYVLSQSDDYAE